MHILLKQVKRKKKRKKLHSYGTMLIFAERCMIKLLTKPGVEGELPTISNANLRRIKKLLETYKIDKK